MKVRHIKIVNEKIDVDNYLSIHSTNKHFFEFADTEVCVPAAAVDGGALREVHVESIKSGGFELRQGFQNCQDYFVVLSTQAWSWNQKHLSEKNKVLVEGISQHQIVAHRVVDGYSHWMLSIKPGDEIRIVVKRTKSRWMSAPVEITKSDQTIIFENELRIYNTASAINLSPLITSENAATDAISPACITKLESAKVGLNAAMGNIVAAGALQGLMHTLTNLEADILNEDNRKAVTAAISAADKTMAECPWSEKNLNILTTVRTEIDCLWKLLALSDQYSKLILNRSDKKSALAEAVAAEISTYFEALIAILKEAVAEAGFPEMVGASSLTLPAALPASLGKIETATESLAIASA